jgi:hypothetical protein
MARSLPEFLEEFVLPLLGGGSVQIDGPLRSRDLELMLEQTGELSHPELRFLRLRRGQELVADPELPDPDADELRLWVGLYNTLVFDHPDRRRVWSRSVVWRRVEGITRSLLTLPAPTTQGETLARHVSVGAFADLVRQDVVVGAAGGAELRAVGQDLPRRVLRMAGPGDPIRSELVRWLEQPHAPEAQRLLEDALRASPLTCVLRPLRAPPAWSPLLAADAFCDRALVRAICHQWAHHRDWVAVGGAVTGALLPSLPDPARAAAAARDAAAANALAGSSPAAPKAISGGHPGSSPAAPKAISGGHPGSSPAAPKALPGAVLPTDPRVLAGVVGALVHLHFLKVLELDARLGVAAVSRDPGVTAFLALPLLLPWLGDVTGTPLGGLPDPGTERGGRDQGFASIARRWTEYLDHLQELVPRSAVDNLLASLVPRIVQTS